MHARDVWGWLKSVPRRIKERWHRRWNTDRDQVIDQLSVMRREREEVLSRQARRRRLQARVDLERRQQR